MDNSLISNAWVWIATISAFLFGDVIACGRCMGSKSSLEKGSCYGDISDLEPTGQQNNGVIGSELSALADWQALQRLKPCIEEAARDNCLQVALIAALISRESRCGGEPNVTNGHSQDGHNFGVFQCDAERAKMVNLACDSGRCCPVTTIVKHFVEDYVKKVQGRYHRWEKARQLQAAVAAFNLKTSKLKTPRRPDKFTTNQDYSNDVIARAQYLLRNGWKNPLDPEPRYPEAGPDSGFEYLR